MVSDTVPTRLTPHLPYLACMLAISSAPDSIPGASTTKTRREPCFFAFCDLRVTY